MANENHTLIKVSQEDADVSAKLSWDADIRDMINAYVGLLMAVGYNFHTIICAISEFLDESTKDEGKDNSLL